jgi:threonine dehydratase
MDAPHETLVTVSDILEARERIASVVRRTPLTSVESIDRACGATVLLKEEYRQRTGSFKIRGAYNHISRLAPGTRVVAASAGNHAQGVALAAQIAGLEAVVFMPSNASLPKVQATRDYGAEVRFASGALDDAVVAAKQWAVAHDAVFVPPFDDPFVIAGQGTLGLELYEQAPEACTVLVPVGGGGLLSGVAVAYRAVSPGTRLIGVEAAGAASMVASLAAREPRTLSSLTTICDGIAVKSPSALTLAHVRDLVDDVVVVDDDAIGEALVVLLERAKAVVEPSGAVGLAAVVFDIEHVETELTEGQRCVVRSDEPIAVVLSGGNVDSLLLSKLIEHGLSQAGRYLRMRIEVPDRPGSLGTVALALGELGLNVLDVEHHREGLSRLDLDEVELAVTVETRGPDHRDEALAELARRGFSVRVDGADGH